MTGDWIIREWDGNIPTNEYRLPGYLSQAEIERILQRLVCRNLEVDEILMSSLRSNDRRRTTLLDRNGRDLPISYGENPHYTADRTTGH